MRLARLSQSFPPELLSPVAVVYAEHASFLLTSDPRSRFDSDRRCSSHGQTFASTSSNDSRDSHIHRFIVAASIAPDIPTY
jgi:hypothetical protein